MRKMRKQPTQQKLRLIYEMYNTLAGIGSQRTSTASQRPCPSFLEEGG